MKKVGILWIGILLLTGCGIKDNDVFTTTCTTSIHSEGFQNDKSYEMIYQDDVISKMVVNYHFTASNDNGVFALNSVKMSFLNDTDKYLSIEGFSLEVVKDEEMEYSANYVLDFTVMHASDIEKFGFSTDYIKQVRIFKDQKMSCE